MEYAHFTSFLLDGTNTNLSPFSVEMQSELFLISFLCAGLYKNHRRLETFREVYPKYNFIQSTSTIIESF